MAYTEWVYNVEGTDEFTAWYASLADDVADQVDELVDLVEQHGHQLKRPHADTLTGSKKIPNLKELRRKINDQTHLRILFAFDPRRTAILLLGGNKSGNWKGWYQTAIPAAEVLYDKYLQELRDEGSI